MLDCSEIHSFVVQVGDGNVGRVSVLDEYHKAIAADMIADKMMWSDELEMWADMMKDNCLKYDPERVKYENEGMRE